VDNYKIINGKKYMWDGQNYELKTTAQENIAKYNQEGFETKLLEAEGQYLVYTRRVVKEIKVEGK
jgi:hypothetical protein